jgi:hypothetical protein
MNFINITDAIERMSDINESKKKEALSKLIENIEDLGVYIVPHT